MIAGRVEGAGASADASAAFDLFDPSDPGDPADPAASAVGFLRTRCVWVGD